MQSDVIKKNLVLFLLILASVVTMIHYGSRKEGYHVDELYSFGLANSEYLPFMHFGVSGYDVKDWMMEYGAGESLGDLFRNLAKDFQILKDCDFQWRDSAIYRDYVIAQANSSDTLTTTWVPGQDYVDYLTVSDHNTFNYASVYYNQRGDVHPPLFYIFLHTTCSIFQGEFSMWFGIVNNIIFLTLAMLVLYRMVRRSLGGEMTALAVVIAYGFSAGIMTTAVFLRMYALLTLAVLLCTDAHLALAEQDNVLDKKMVRRLMLTVLMGYMTHYYFVLFAMGLALVTGIRMVGRKQWKSLLAYAGTIAGSAAIGLVIWPFSVKHVFGGYRGQQALLSLTGGFSFQLVQLYGRYIFYGVFGGHAWILFEAAALIILGCILLKVRRFPLGKLALITVPVVLYLLVTARIVPYLTDRYLMCLYPFFMIYVVCGFAYLGKRAAGRFDRIPRAVVTFFPLAVGLLLCLANNAFVHTPGYLFPGGQETIPVPDHTVCVYVLPDGDWNESAEETNVLAKCDRVAVCYISNLSVLEGTYTYTPGETVMIVVQDGLDVEETEAAVRDVLGIQDLPETDRGRGTANTKIYLGSGE